MTTGDIWSQLDYISQRAAADQDVLQDAIGLGQTVIEDEDKGAIAIGILASTLMKHYAKNEVGRFADSIGIGRSTAYKRAQVVNFYDADALDYLVDTEGRRGIPVSEQGQPIIGEFTWEIGAYRIVIYNYQTFCTYAAWREDTLVCGDRVTSLFVALSVCVDAIGKHMAQAVQA